MINQEFCNYVLGKITVKSILEYKYYAQQNIFMAMVKIYGTRMEEYSQENSEKYNNLLHLFYKED